LNWKNYLVAAVLSAIVLALVFIPLSGSQTAMPYDPWADINDDGTIDIKDVSYSARLFGTTGDPTKQVIITFNHTSASYAIPIPAGTGGYINITAAGYKQITLYLYVPDVTLKLPVLCSYSYMANISVATAFLIENMSNCMEEHPIYFTVWVNMEPIVYIITQPSARSFLPGYAPKAQWTRARI
jgi:hypothetical protein